MTAALRVGVYLADQNPHRDRSQGITVMTNSLVRSMSARPDVALGHLVSRSSVGADVPADRVIPWSTDHVPGRLAGDVLHPWWQRGGDVDVWWYPKGNAPILVGTRRPAVGFMADAIVVHYADHHPDTRHRLDLAFWVRQLRRSLRWFDRVSVPTEHARRQLLDVCDRWSIDPPVLQVIGEGSEWETRRRSAGGRAAQVVHFAARAPHKRTDGLLRGWSELVRRGVDMPELVLVGSVSAEAERLISSIPRVVRTGWLDDAQLHTTISSASALVLPSEIEGFGIPALEAAYVGTPVLFAPGTAVAEVVGPLGDWGSFDVDDPSSLLAALERVDRVPPAEIDRWGDDLYERFALERVTDRLLAELRAAVR